eukprot:16439529-Heterocapsa_arctica.AAC.1
MGRDMTDITVAKNCRPDRTGFSASSRAFGSDETLPEYREHHGQDGKSAYRGDLGWRGQRLPE